MGMIHTSLKFFVRAGEHYSLLFLLNCIAYSKVSYDYFLTSILLYFTVNHSKWRSDFPCIKCWKTWHHIMMLRVHNFSLSLQLYPEQILFIFRWTVNGERGTFCFINYIVNYTFNTSFVLWVPTRPCYLNQFLKLVLE